MEQRDYSARVEKTTQDEIGYLVDTFNAMLDEVEKAGRSIDREPVRRLLIAHGARRSQPNASG